MKVAFMETPSPWLVRPNAQTSLGLLYLATVAKQKGYNVSYYKPATIEDMEDLVEYDVVCMGGTTLEYQMNLKCCDYLQDRNPDIKILAGGSHVTASAEECLVNGRYDAICVGEGEQTILDMLDDIRYGMLEKFYGEKRWDINDIPYPDRSLIPGSHGGDIFANGHNYMGEGHENFITSRGCHFDCAFCSSKAMSGGVVRERSIENICGELKRLYADGVRQLRICDDNIAANRIRLNTLVWNVIKVCLEVLS